MGIGVYGEGDAHLLAELDGGVVQVEAVGIGVDFHGDAMLDGGSEDGFEVELNGIAAFEETSLGVADDGDGRMGNGADHAGGLGFAGEVEMGVDGADDDIELLQRGVGLVEGAVFEDVDLLATEDGEAGEGGVGGGDFFGLLGETVGVQTVGHGEAGGMVGDGDVVVAEDLGGAGHFQDGGFAVRPGGVAMEIAADVGGFDEVRERAIGGGGDFATVFP